MSAVSIYLNFQGQCAAAFQFYQAVFGTEFSAPLSRMKDLPPNPNAPTLSAAEQDYVLHVALPIINGTQIMGTDMLESMGHKLVVGNNTTINLLLDSREEADKYYAALSTKSSECAPMTEQFWGYWGCCLDQFGIRWMFNVMNQNF
ncbi:MAG: VOC family protein [Bacteroidetes bacterium]|nr:VOC family protein [Bacteroidota bacterium]